LRDQLLQLPKEQRKEEWRAHEVQNWREREREREKERWRERDAHLSAVSQSICFIRPKKFQEPKSLYTWEYAGALFHPIISSTPAFLHPIPFLYIQPLFLHPILFFLLFFVGRILPPFFLIFWGFFFKRIFIHSPILEN